MLQRCSHATLVRARRGALGITSAFKRITRERALAAFSADGVRRGAGHSFSVHLASAEGQAELHAFQERVSTRAEAQLKELAEGKIGR